MIKRLLHTGVWLPTIILSLSVIVLASGQLKSCAPDIPEWTTVVGASVRSTRIQANFDTPVNTVQWQFKLDNGGVFNELYFVNCPGTSSPVEFSSEVNSSGCVLDFTMGAGSEPSTLGVEINNCSTELPASNPANNYRTILNKICYATTQIGENSGGIETLSGTCNARQGLHNNLSCSFDSQQTAVADVYHTSNIPANFDSGNGPQWVDINLKSDTDVYKINYGWYTTGNLVFTNCDCLRDDGSHIQSELCRNENQFQWYIDNGCLLPGLSHSNPVMDGQTVLGYRNIDFYFRCFKQGGENVIPMNTSGVDYFKVCLKALGTSGTGTFGGNCTSEDEAMSTTYGCVTRPYSVNIVP